MSPLAKQAAYSKKRVATPVSYKWVGWLLPLVVVCAVLFYAEDYLANPETLPINKVRVHGEFVNVDEAMLHRVIDGVVKGGYFNIDVERVREVVETLAWVDKASVRRVWPDTLSVSVSEQHPVAISREFGFINASGDVFKPLGKIKENTLPVFDGAISLNKMMLDKFYKMNMLLSKQKLTITDLQFDARHAIKLKLNNGLKVILGRGETMHRLERFISIYSDSLEKLVNDIDAIDLRYTNGMAISWKNKKSLGDMKHV